MRLCIISASPSFAAGTSRKKWHLAHYYEKPRTGHHLKGSNLGQISVLLGKSRLGGAKLLLF